MRVMGCGCVVMACVGLPPTPRLQPVDTGGKKHPTLELHKVIINHAFIGVRGRDPNRISHACVRAWGVAATGNSSVAIAAIVTRALTHVRLGPLALVGNLPSRIH